MKGTGDSSIINIDSESVNIEGCGNWNGFIRYGNMRLINIFCYIYIIADSLVLLLDVKHIFYSTITSMMRYM